MPEESIPIELDQAIRDAVREYAQATQDRDDAAERRRKLGDAIKAHLAIYGANVGLIDGVPAVTLTQYERESVDSKRLREEEPYTYRKFLRLTKVEALYLRGER